MYNLRNEIVKSIIATLKIADTPFNTETVREMIASIPDLSLKHFYKSLFGDQHVYLNGLDRVAKAAEQFKLVVTDNVEEEAKELIELCESLNTHIRKDAEAKGEDFKKLVYRAKFPTLDVDKIVILDNVRPHYSHKDLIINIRHYQTAKDALDAFKYAIRDIDKSLSAIESSRVQKMIGAKK